MRRRPRLCAFVRARTAARAFKRRCHTHAPKPCDATFEPLPTRRTTTTKTKNQQEQHTQTKTLKHKNIHKTQKTSRAARPAMFHPLMPIGQSSRRTIYLLCSHRSRVASALGRSKSRKKNFACGTQRTGSPQTRKYTKDEATNAHAQNTLRLPHAHSRKILETHGRARARAPCKSPAARVLHI